VRDFGSVLELVRKDIEVVIQRRGRPLAIITPPEQLGRVHSESAAPAEVTAEMDDDFAKDIQEAIDSDRDPFDPPKWDGL